MHRSDQQIELMSQMPESRVLAVVDRGRWTRECIAKLERACAMVEIRASHRIHLVSWEPAGGFQICDGLLFIDCAVCGAGSTPSIELDSTAPEDVILSGLLRFVVLLESSRQAREEQAAEALLAQAKAELSAKEWRAFEIARRTWSWTQPEWMTILTRGLKLTRQERELATAGVAMRDSRQSRFGWRKIRDDLWAEFNR